MFKKKIICLVNIFLSLIFLTQSTLNFVYSDDELEEIENTDGVIEVNVNYEEQKPSINSREAIVIDRKSKKIIYGKNENKRVPMASTTNLITT